MSVRSGLMGLGVGLLLLLPLSAGAEEYLPDNPAARPFNQLEKDIPSLYLINGLNLSADQAAKLAVLLDQAGKATAEADQKTQQTLQSRQPDCDAAVKELLGAAAGGSGKPAAGSRLGKVIKMRGDLAKSRRAEAKTLDGLADKAYDLLTASQRAVVQSFSPCFVPPNDFKNPERVGQATGDTSVMEAALTRIRAQANERNGYFVFDRVLDRLVPYAMEKRRIAYSDAAAQETRDELAAAIESVLPRMEKMKDADFELEKKNLAKEVLPLEKATDPGSVRRMIRQYVLNPGLLDVLQKRGQVKADGKSPAPAAAGAAPALGLERTLGGAVLLNGLDLTPEQVGKTLPIVRAAVQARAEVEREMLKVMNNALDPYRRLRDELAAGQPTARTESTAKLLHGGVKQLQEDRLAGALLKCQADLDKVMTAGQVAYLASGKKDMLKSGAQGHDATIKTNLELAVRCLMDARALSASDFAKQRDGVCKKFVNDSLKDQSLEPGAVDVPASAKAAGAVLDRVRKLNDADFGKQKNDLAAELCPKLAQPRPTTYGTKYLKGEPVPEVSPSTKILFSPETLSVLEKMAAK